MEKFILWLISMDISNKNKLYLIEEYGDEKNVFDDFENISKLNPRIFKKFKCYNKFDELQKSVELLKRVKKINASYITISMDEYPEKLKRLHEPPYFFFYIGDIGLLNNESVGIVGSRKNSIYGERVTKFITKEIVSYGFTIISGGAMGIDSVAHRSAIENCGKTIAVLGSGIDNLYPLTNKKLFSDIMREGLIISEFLLGVKPLPYNFPRRNRIISALSDKLLVTEATKKSGSMITVGYSLELGCDVGAVPGSIFSPGGSGCNDLLREGATIVHDKDSLCDFLGVSKKEIENKNESLELELLKIISDEPVHIDDIFINSKVDRNTFYRVLFEMQIKKEIMSLPGEYYVRVL